MVGIAGFAAIPIIMQPARAAERHDVLINQFEFLPQIMDVRVGDEIRWLNEDLAPHTATSDDESWDTGGLETGDAGVVTVTEDMIPTYYCAYHPHMKGEIRILG